MTGTIVIEVMIANRKMSVQRGKEENSVELEIEVGDLDALHLHTTDKRIPHKQNFDVQ